METLSVLKRFITRGNASLDTVPPLDGALLPNNLLEDAPRHRAGDLPEPDQLVVHGGNLVVSAGSSLYRLGSTQRSWETFATFSGPITAFVPYSDGWLVAADAELCRVDSHGRITESVLLPGGVGACVVDIAPMSDGAVAIAVGSATAPASEWHVDLMQRGKTGSIWVGNPDLGSWEKLRDGLAWPAGLAYDGSALTYTEAWRHSIGRMPVDGGPSTVLARNLPGYPGRIRLASGGGYWLAMFAVRTQLVEFVLTQDDYRAAMMREIDPRYWVRPDLRTLNTGLVPLQAAASRSSVRPSRGRHHARTGSSSA